MGTGQLDWNLRQPNISAEPRRASEESRCRLRRVLASSSTLEPAAQGRLGFPRAPTSEKTIDADVFIEIRPVNSLAFPDQTPVPSFGFGAMRQSRVPRERNSNRAPIEKVHDQDIVGKPHPLRPRFGGFSRRR